MRAGSCMAMEAVEVQQDFVSVGVNRVTNALAWGASGSGRDLVAYGAHHMVALYDPEVSAW